MTQPLLLAFAEPVASDSGVASARLGTETFTKTIEGSDTDALEAAAPVTMAALAAGTATHMAASEEQDDDRGSAAECALGTETYTEVRAEHTDSDEPGRHGALWEAALL